jgi:hypothetical protein
METENEMMPWTRLRNWWRTNPLYAEQLWAWARLLFLIVSIPAFAMLMMWAFESAHPLEIARNIREISIWTKLIPRPVALLMTPLWSWKYARYLLAPLGAFLLVFVYGALYVQDIYKLETFSAALRYVRASLLGIAYPRLTIDGGKKEIGLAETNTLDKIGGPGFVLIQPGNAALFKKPGFPSAIHMPENYFLTPFETIGPIADLTDQEGYRDEAWTVTLDGIQLHLRDIRFRYRLIPKTENGTVQPRSPQSPYPFSEDTLLDSFFNLSAKETWQSGVERMVVGGITGFINEHTIDYLTAPRRFDRQPRRELRMQLFTESIQQRLRKVGADLIWVDVGHLDIIELSEDPRENVDGQRLDYWASRWLGEIKRLHAIGEATRVANQERGRVEAQAAFLQSITESLRGFEQTEDPAENLRRLLLIRTAQILEAMGEKPQQRGTTK